jgi:hypothetical protein
MALEPPQLPQLVLVTAADFTAAYGQLFILLEERPLNVLRVENLWAAMNAYVQHHPCPTWPLVLVAADGARKVIESVPQLLLLMSLDTLSQN